MRPVRRVAALTATLTATLLVVLVGAAPATAATLAIDDPSGDAEGPGLDVTRAFLSNGDAQVRVRVRFDELTRGDLIVSVDPRGKRGVRLVSERAADGTHEDHVVGGAFTDRRGGQVLECAGFRVRWSDERPVATLRLPSTCLRDGDYGAVRYAVLTERRSGDTDYAPDNRRGVTGWIPRG